MCNNASLKILSSLEKIYHNDILPDNDYTFFSMFFLRLSAEFSYDIVALLTSSAALSSEENTPMFLTRSSYSITAYSQTTYTFIF